MLRVWFLVCLVFFSSSLSSYPFYFKSTPFSKCNVNFTKNFLWKEKNFENEKILKELEFHSKKLAEIRIQQLQCIKNLANSEKEKLDLIFLLEKYRELELELLEYGKNFYYVLEKEHLFEPQESEALKQYITTKTDLYSSLYEESLNFLESSKESWKFEKFYLSQLLNKFYFLKSLRKEVRDKIIETISH